MKIQLLLGVATGCSSSNALDCDWLMHDNCWRSTLAAAASCLPAGEGTFSADFGACTAPSGTQLTFDQPVVIPVPPFGEPWLFTLGSGTSTCMRYEERSLSIKLTTTAG